jgi:hypothetical protein
VAFLTHFLLEDERSIFNSTTTDVKALKALCLSLQTRAMAALLKEERSGMSEEQVTHNSGPKQCTIAAIEGRLGKCNVLDRFDEQQTSMTQFVHSTSSNSNSASNMQASVSRIPLPVKSQKTNVRNNTSTSNTNKKQKTNTQFEVRK